MIKKTIVAALLLGALATPNLAAVGGILMTNVTEPAFVNSGVDTSYTKKAEGSMVSILGLVGSGDAGIDTIAAKAGITKIKFVNRTINSILWFYCEEKITVFGD